MTEDEATYRVLVINLKADLFLLPELAQRINTAVEQLTEILREIPDEPPIDLGDLGRLHSIVHFNSRCSTDDLRRAADALEHYVEAFK